MFLNFVGLFQGMKILLWAFSRAENFVIFYQGLWAEKTNVFFFFHTYFKGVLIYFEGLKKLMK